MKKSVFLKEFKSKEEGVTLIFAALMFVALLGFAALAVDMGMNYYKVNKLQNALDAAVLAGTTILPAKNDATGQPKWEEAQDTAVAYMAANGGGNRNRSDFVKIISPENLIIGMKANLEVKSDSFFSRIWGNGESEFKRISAAKLAYTTETQTITTSTFVGNKILPIAVPVADIYSNNHKLLYSAPKLNTEINILGAEQGSVSGTRGTILFPGIKSNPAAVNASILSGYTGSAPIQIYTSGTPKKELTDPYINAFDQDNGFPNGADKALLQRLASVSVNGVNHEYKYVNGQHTCSVCGTEYDDPAKNCPRYVTLIIGEENKDLFGNDVSVVRGFCGVFITKVDPDSKTVQAKGYVKSINKTDNNAFITTTTTTQSINVYKGVTLSE